MLTEAEYRQVTRLPDQIDGTFAKLERLLTKAEALGYRADNWRETWEALQSRFLTDPKLIDRQWEREIAAAKEASR